MRISVVTPTRNRHDWLPRAVASVMAQSFTDWEQVVYDNGDNPDPWVLGDPTTRDGRVRYIQGPADGPADAFRKAIALARGEIVTLLSDDDRLPPDALETAEREIGDYNWLTGLTSFEDREGNVRFLLGGPLDIERLKQDYYLGGAIYWKRELTERLGSMKLEYDGAQDYEMYLRFALDSTPRFVEKVLYRYTDHPGTDSHVRRENQMAKTAEIKRLAA